MHMTSLAAPDQTSMWTDRQRIPTATPSVQHEGVCAPRSWQSSEIRC